MLVGYLLEIVAGNVTLFEMFYYTAAVKNNFCKC